MKILIIDDEPTVVEFLRKGLTANMYVVDSAADGERGAFLARTGHYDLIILDYSLPKLDGAAVLKEIREEKRHVPVLMLTVRATLDDKKNIFALGADDYLTKPFLFEELLLRIRALLKRPAQIEPESYRVANLNLSSRTKIVRRGGREIYLTRREFALLEFLMRSRGQIVSRSEILENVWSYDSDPFSNSIETHMASLRRKINANRQSNLIHTFTGRGYKLAPEKLG